MDSVAPTSDLAAAVSAAVRSPVEGLEIVLREPIDYDAFLAGRRLSRMRGDAVTRDGRVPWSMIEKVTEGPATASPYLYDNGLREHRAYESGLLDDLAPGLAAPAAYGLHEAGDGRLTLWLEDLGADRRRMRREDLLLTARHLGRLAGAWMGRVPDGPWLFTGWIERHSQPEAVERDLARLRGLRQPDVVEACVGLPVTAAIELIERQPAVAALLRGLPQTLCHHDAVGANVFTRRWDGMEETVLIDWEMVGPGPVGADLASLLFASPRRGDVSATLARDTIPAALAAFGDGMRDVGQPADVETVTLGFHAAVALRWSLARDVILAVDAGTQVFRGSAMDESPEEALHELVTLLAVLEHATSAVQFSAPWRDLVRHPGPPRHRR